MIPVIVLEAICRLPDQDVPAMIEVVSHYAKTKEDIFDTVFETSGVKRYVDALWFLIKECLEVL